MPPYRTLETMDSALVEGDSKSEKSIAALWDLDVHQFINIHYPTFIQMKIYPHIFLPFFVFAILQCTKSKQHESEEKFTVGRNEMPTMHITTLDHASIETQALKGNFIFILFQPDCDHCQREAQEIRKHLSSFDAYHIYFLSADPIEAVQKFATEYSLLGHPNISFAITTVEDVIRNFGSIPAPSVYIYRDQQLIQKFNGEVEIGKILEVL